MTKDQLKALQATWNRLDSEADQRLFLPVAHQLFVTDPREHRLRWTHIKLGRRIGSWTELELKEAEYLLDLLLHGATKLDRALDNEFKRIGVREIAPYVEEIVRPTRYSGHRTWSYGGRAFAEFNRIDKIKLMNVLTTRPSPLTSERKPVPHAN